MITGVICRLTAPTITDNILAEFQMWFELADAGDSLSVQFYSGNSTDTPVYRGGLEWRGSANGKVLKDWSLYRIYYPGLAKDNNTVWVQWQFSSDTNNNPAKGPWLDDLAVSSYQKPQPATACERNDPTFAGGQSKGLVLPPYAEDIKNSAPDQITAMISRLQGAGVNWVRLEFRVNPSSFTNPAIDPLNPLTSAYNHIDLRHYDRLIDSLCANNIAILGLVDNQTMVRQDWQDSDIIPPTFIVDFRDTVTQLVQYFDDRIGNWEIWNEPDYEKSRLVSRQYGALLGDIFNAIRTVQPNDKVLFGGLGSADQNAVIYFRAALATITSSSMPFDLFALHPYPSGQYRKADGHVELDPGYYLRGEIEARPGTILTKFRTTLDNPAIFLPNETGKTIWATELGWNSAKGAMPCPNFLDLVTTQAEQACYVQHGLHSLFDLTPSVAKVFWYQYHDTGTDVEDKECGNSTTTAAWVNGLPSPSWYASAAARYFVRASGVTTVNIPWSFGMYDGNLKDTKPVRAAFFNYPTTDAACMATFPNLPALADLQQKVYLPLINGNLATVAGQ